MTMQNGVGALVSVPQQSRQSGQQPGSSVPFRSVGVGAVSFGTPRGVATGLGIPGPWGVNPAQTIDAGTYEITGTQVRLRAKPGTSQDEVSLGTTFNGAYGDNGGKVAGTPDQVEFAGTNAKDAVASADGLKWAFVGVKSGMLAGQKGWVAMEYMGPVGWTASHGGTGPVPQGQPQPGPEPSSDTTTKKSNYIPWIIGGVVLTGIVVGGAIMGKKHHARARHAPAHHAPAHAHEARRRRRRYR